MKTSNKLIRGKVFGIISENCFLPKGRSIFPMDFRLAKISMVLTLGLLIIAKNVSGQNAPVLSDVPVQTIGLGAAFEPLDMSSYLTELDGDGVIWSYEFLVPSQSDANPTWSINAADFQFNMSVIAVVESRGVSTTGLNHKLAAFSGNELRGVTSAIDVGGVWMYFLTVYGNTEGDAIQFKFFDETHSLVLPVLQDATFASNQVIGDVTDPVAYQAGNVLLSISTSGIIDFTIPDVTMTFADSVNIIVTDDTPEALADTTILALLVNDDFAPIISGIPSQELLFEEEFSTFDLDDYLTLNDGDDITLSAVSDLGALTIAINAERIVTITKPSTDWSGSELITFTVTDVSDNAFSSNTTAMFTVLPFDNAPAINPIADQKTRLGLEFNELNLSDYLVEQDGDEVAWSYEFLSNGVAEGDPNWSVNASDFEFSMTLTATVTAFGQSSTSAAHSLAAFDTTQLRGVTQAVQVGSDWVYFLTIYSNEITMDVSFQFYDADHDRTIPIKQSIAFEPNAVIGNPVAPEVLEAGQFLLNIDDNAVLSVEIVDTTFVGSESVVFVLSDLGTANSLQATDTVVFTVTDEPFPNLSNIPNQMIEEGQTFATLDLSEYLIDFEAVGATWSFSGNTELTINIVDSIVTILTPNADWYGEELITFNVQSIANPEFVDAVNVVFQVNNINDVPVFASSDNYIVPVTTEIQALLTVTDIDSELITFSFENLPSWLSFTTTSKSITLRGTPSEDDKGNHIFNLLMNDGDITITQSLNFLATIERIIPLSTRLIEEGSSYAAFNLKSQLEIIGTKAVVWEVSGGVNLTYNIVEDTLLMVSIPDADWYGKDTVQVLLKDAQSSVLLDQQLFIHQITNVNDAPEFITTTLEDGIRDQLYEARVEVADVDNEELTYTLESAPDWLRLVAERKAFTFFGVPDVAQDVSFSVVISDGDLSTTQVFSLTITAILGIEDEQQIAIYPNPTTDFVTINLLHGKSKVYLLDYTGHIIYSEYVTGKSNIDLSKFSTGIYFLTYESNGKRQSRKIVKE